MSADAKPPKPSGDLATWAQALYDWLSKDNTRGRVVPKPILLAHRKTNRGERASVSGLVIYDQLVRSPIYSLNGEWRTLGSTHVNISDQVSSYTLAMPDAGKVVAVDSANAATVSIPTHADVPLQRGTVLSVMRLGSGGVSVTGVAGVSVNGVAAGTETIAARYRSVRLLKVAENAWIVREGGF